MDANKYKEMIHNIIVPATLSYEEQCKAYEPLSIFLKNEIPEHLYRFRQCNERSISAFEQDQLWFAPAAEMNDDFDSLLFFNRQDIRVNLECFFDNFQNYISKIKNGEGIPDSVKSLIPTAIIQNKFQQMSDSSIESLRKETYLFLTQQAESGFPIIQHLIQNVHKIACFSEAINSADMWGYYGDSGKGFAIAYDFRNQNYIDSELYDNSIACPSTQTANLYQIIYDDAPYDATKFAEWLLQHYILINNLPNPQLYYLFQHTIPCPDVFMSTKILLHKSISWKHESEWRLIHTYNTNNILSEKYLYEKKRPSAIYLGRSISPINEKILKNIATEKKIPVYKMTISNDESTYKLIPNLI